MNAFRASFGRDITMTWVKACSRNQLHMADSSWCISTSAKVQKFLEWEMLQTKVGGKSELCRCFNRPASLLTFVCRRKLTFVCISVNVLWGMPKRRFKED